MRRWIGIGLWIFSVSVMAAGTPKKLDWQSYDRDAFTQAQQENKYVLLNLKAVWCHWCHVMDGTTYQSPKVLKLIEKHFVPVKVDHDARPDLAERYREWGWPATIVLNGNGTEIVKRAGYLSPDGMSRLLQAIVDDPSPEGATLQYPKRVQAQPSLSRAIKQSLQRKHLATFDNELGGLKIAQKFIERDSLSWDMQLASQGERAAKDRAILTLDSGLNLMDPAFGGVYQYSTHGDWQHPHYEKIMKVQAGYLRVYAQAYRQFKDPKYLAAAKSIASYLNEFLSDSSGAFYTSQDADLNQGEKGHDYFALSREERLKQGLPRIDTHRYSAETADALDGFLVLYQVIQEAAYLKRAESALAWVLRERRLGKGGYRHNQRDDAGPYLVDTLNMVRALWRYHQVTGNQNALTRAKEGVDFMQTYFAHPTAGLVSAADNGTPVAPLPQIDQNITAARTLLHLYQTTGYQPALTLAESVMRYLNSPEVAQSRITEAGLLQLDALYQSVTQGAKKAS